jgi:hemerythrin-like metal-binding protein
MNIAWNPSLQLGISGIDHDHHTQVDLFNRLDAAAKDGDVVAIRAELDAFLRHTREHFEREEAFLRQAAYEGLSHHRAIHQALMAQVSGVADRLSGEAGTERLADTLDFLRDWLIRHITEVDRQFVRAVGPRG